MADHTDPRGTGILYLSTLTTPESKALLESSVDSLLAAIDTRDAPKPHALYQLYYEQQCNDDLALAGEQRIFKFPPPPAALTFDDASLDAVYEAWKKVVGGDDTPEETLAEYMVFADREGVADDDDYE